MRRRGLLLAFGLTALMMSSSMGCIGLLPAREMLETMHDDPEVLTVEQRTGLNHTFEGLSPAPYYGSEEIEMTSDVSEIRIYFAAGMPIADSIDALPLDSVRYVNAKLVDADGSIFWSINATNTTRPPVKREYPPFNAGTWTLEVDARGYGLEAVGFEMKDDFVVQVTVYRRCTTYAGEDACAET